MQIERYKEVKYCIKCGSNITIKEDISNVLRPHCSNCDWIYYINPVPAVACLVINEQEEVLLIKRKFPPNENEWALPSGYIEIWQTPEEAAIAELLEETSLHGEIDHFIDYYCDNSQIYERVLSFGFKLIIKEGVIQAGDDALEAKYFKLTELPLIAFKSHYSFIIKELTNTLATIFKNK